MIEKTIINGRSATVAYTDESFNPIDNLSGPHLAHVWFDDAQETILLRSPGHKRVRALKQVGEQEAFLKRRARQQLPRTTSVETPHETKSARVARAETWKDAIKIIDASEPEIRDIIERGLLVRGATYGERILQISSLVDQIAAVRMKAFKKAFRLVRDKGV